MLQYLPPDTPYLICLRWIDLDFFDFSWFGLDMEIWICLEDTLFLLCMYSGLQVHNTRDLSGSHPVATIIRFLFFYISSFPFLDVCTPFRLYECVLYVVPALLVERAIQ